MISKQLRAGNGEQLMPDLKFQLKQDKYTMDPGQSNLSQQ